MRTVALYGGQPKRTQIAYLRRTACLPGGGVHLVVATPGRLNDLLGFGEIVLTNVSIVVLDEADRMLDMGFSLLLVFGCIGTDFCK